jgi:hypothetical protein
MLTIIELVAGAGRVLAIVAMAVLSNMVLALLPVGMGAMGITDELNPGDTN